MAVISIDAGVALVKTCRARGQTIAVTIGVFDLLHVGHTHQLAAARREADVLLVSVRADRSVRGPHAADPVTPENERAELVAALASVDAVVIVDDAAFDAVVERLQPNVLVVSVDAGLGEVKARAAVERSGGRVVVAPDSPEWSIDAILARARRGA